MTELRLRLIKNGKIFGYERWSAYKHGKYHRIVKHFSYNMKEWVGLSIVGAVEFDSFDMGIKVGESRCFTFTFHHVRC